MLAFANASCLSAASSRPAAIQAGSAALYKLPSCFVFSEPSDIFCANSSRKFGFLRSTLATLLVAAYGSVSAPPLSTESYKSGVELVSLSTAATATPASAHNA